MKVKVYDKSGREFLKNCQNPILFIIDGKDRYVACCKCNDCKKSLKELGYGLQRRDDEN